MSGPVAEVLLPIKMTAEVEAAIRGDIQGMANHVEGDDFWVQRRPFILDPAPPHSEDADRSMCTGWAIQSSIGLYAMCNDDLDLRLLGEMCLHFARKFGGWVDFCGELRPWTTDLQNLPGRLCGHRCVSTSTSHLGDAEFLEAWLQCPDFHMIK